MVSNVIAELAKRHGLKPPKKHSVVHKAECVYSTDTEKCPDGIYINLKTFQSFGSDSLAYDTAGTEALYLHVKRFLVPVVPEEAGEAPETQDEKQEAEASTVVYKPKKLYEEVVKYGIWSPALQEPVPLDEVPSAVADICKSVIDHAGFDFKTEEFAWQTTIANSRYADHLLQVKDPPVVRYEKPSCHRCGANTNLWLNLSDGYVGCGRKNFGYGGCADGEEGAALQHYNRTGGIFPLVVKIGTITPTSADVYSYAPDEDSLVIDPHLAEHLRYFGLDINNLKKTEKTTLQLEREKNQHYDWSEMNQPGREVVYGPGLIGLDNLGNSCYMNSAIQLLATVDELSAYFVEHYDCIARSVPSDTEPHNDFLLQLAKTIRSMVTDRVVKQQLELIDRCKRSCEEAGLDYVESEEYKNFHFKPGMLKYAVANLKSQFANNEQQDAEEFLSSVINLLEDKYLEIKRRCKEPLKIKDIFYFKTRQSIVCDDLKKITYNDNDTHMISLPLRYENGSDKSADNEEEIGLERCFKNWAEDQEIEYLQGDKKHRAIINKSFMTLPKYLLVNIERFYFKEDFTAGKIMSHITIPTEGILLETDAKRQPEGYTVEYNTRETKKDKVQPNPELMQELMSMGFTEKLCRLACLKSGARTLEGCANWILTNMETVSDDDTDVALNTSALMELGYSHERASKAAELFGGNVEAAVEWLTNKDGVAKTTAAKKATYKPVGVISHIGSSANTGHYVFHAYRDGQWYIFNDSKVLKCDSIPTSNGYIYLLKRCELETDNAEAGYTGNWQ